MPIRDWVTVMWYIMDFTHFWPLFIYVFKVFYMHLKSFRSFYRFRYSFEESDIFGVLWNLFEKLCWNHKGGSIIEDIHRSTSHLHNRSTENQRYRSTASHPREHHLRKSQVLPKTPSYCTISPWPHVRLFIRVLYHFRRRPSWDLFHHFHTLEEKSYLIAWRT